MGKPTLPESRHQERCWQVLEHPTDTMLGNPDLDISLMLICHTQKSLCCCGKHVHLVGNELFSHSSNRCPPRTFLPALCKIFLDESAPDNVLEVTARAITYYLDVSAECTRRIVGVDGAIKALCNRLVVVELNNRTSRDLAEQCVKVCCNNLLQLQNRKLHEYQVQL